MHSSMTCHVYTSTYQKLKSKYKTQPSAPPEISLILLSRQLSPPPLQRYQLADFYYHRMLLAGLEFHINGIIQHGFFCIWLLSSA